MNDTNRQEGFWWVRIDGERWCVGEADRAPVKGSDRTTLLLHTRGRSLFASSTAIEWGPYLGKGPAHRGHTERCGTAYRGCAPDCTFERDRRIFGGRRTGKTAEALRPLREDPSSGMLARDTPATRAMAKRERLSVEVQLSDGQPTGHVLLRALPQPPAGDEG